MGKCDFIPTGNPTNAPGLPGGNNGWLVRYVSSSINIIHIAA